MIEAIHSRLHRWAEWTLRRAAGGLGYPRECSYTRLQGRSGGGFIPGMDAEAWATEQAVIWLKHESPLLHQAVHVYYLRSMTIEQRCRACQCGKTTFFDRLQAAHIKLQQQLGNIIKQNA